MLVDRYVKLVLTVIAVALSIIATRLSLPAPSSAEAQGGVPKYEVTVPKSWGRLVAFSNNNLLLEAPDQSLRIVDVDGKPPEYPRVKVLVRWQ